MCIFRLWEAIRATCHRKHTMPNKQCPSRVVAGSSKRLAGRFCQLLPHRTIAPVDEEPDLCFADERCTQPILDCLRTTDFGRRMGPDGVVEEAQSE